MRLQWKLVSILSDIVLILMQDRSRVCIGQAWKSFWTHPMELLGDMGYVESDFFLFGESVSVSARYVHGLHQMYHRLRNQFGRT